MREYHSQNHLLIRSNRFKLIITYLFFSVLLLEYFSLKNKNKSHLQSLRFEEYTFNFSIRDTNVMGKRIA